MDRLEQYRGAVERILGEYMESTPEEPQLETLSIRDREGGHYIFLEVGWQPPRRIYNVVFHLRLKDGKIWVEEDWTEKGVARDLLAAGIPPDMIELGFQPPEMRPYIEWPVAVTR